MSTFEGIKSWFQSRKYEDTINELRTSAAKIHSLLKEIDKLRCNPIAKRKILKSFEKSNALINQLISRYKKLSEKDVDRLEKINMEKAREFKEDVKNLEFAKSNLYNLFTKDSLTEDNKNLIIRLIITIIPDRLNDLNNEVNILMNPKRVEFFEKRSANQKVYKEHKNKKSTEKWQEQSHT